MRINAPGAPQQHGAQPEIHTFIGDTPRVPEEVEPMIEDTSFSAVRAIKHTASQLRVQDEDCPEEAEFDIRKASAGEQARWLASGESLT